MNNEIFTVFQFNHHTCEDIELQKSKKISEFGKQLIEDLLNKGINRPKKILRRLTSLKNKGTICIMI